MGRNSTHSLSGTRNRRDGSCEDRQARVNGDDDAITSNEGRATSESNFRFRIDPANNAKWQYTCSIVIAHSGLPFVCAFYPNTLMHNKRSITAVLVLLEGLMQNLKFDSGMLSIVDYAIPRWHFRNATLRQ